MVDWLGWIATAVFASSYFVKGSHQMRYVQAAASLLWIGYGVILKAPPIIVANIIVAALAVGSTLRKPVPLQN